MIHTIKNNHGCVMYQRFICLFLATFLVGCGPQYRYQYAVSFDQEVDQRSQELMTLQCQRDYDRCVDLESSKYELCSLRRAYQYQLAYSACMNNEDNHDRCRWLATINTPAFCYNREDQCTNELYQCLCLKGASVTVIRECVGQCEDLDSDDLIRRIPMCPLL
jgi:hypothetical protein